MGRILEILLKGPAEMADKTFTGGGLTLLILVAVATVTFLFFYSQRESNWLRHYAMLAGSVFIFEVFTTPMWVNNHFGPFGYLYQDVSWVLTFGWTTLMLSIILIVDHVWGRLEAWKRFLVYLAGMSIFGFLAEMLVMNLGLRSYSPEVINSLSGVYIYNTPIDTLYYVPVFSALVIGLYKYFAFVIDGRAIVPVRGGWMRRLSISLVAVFLFEIMIEPMVINANFPQWSYIFHDISVILTIGWVILMWLSIMFVEKVWPNFSIAERFALSVVTIGLISLPIESWLISAGYRVYEGTTAGNAFSGVTVPLLNTPAEVAFALPMYFALIVGFVRVWDIMLTNPLRSTHVPTPTR